MLTLYFPIFWREIYNSQDSSLCFCGWNEEMFQKTSPELDWIEAACESQSTPQHAIRFEKDS